MSLENAHLKTVIVKTPNFFTPKIGYRWLLLYGVVGHVTGEVTTVKIEMKDGRDLRLIFLGKAALGTDTYDLFTHHYVLNLVCASWSPTIIDETMQITLAHGGTPASSMRFVVLEWNPEEGEKVEQRKGFWRDILPWH